MNSLLDLLPRNIWKDISFYCFNEFRVLSKESYDISMIHYPNIMKSVDIKQKIWDEKICYKIPHIMIKNLINCGIYDIDDYLIQDGHTFIFYTTMRNDLKSVKYLLDNNANIYLFDLRKWSPLHFASSKINSYDIIKCLIDKAIEYDNNGTSKMSLKEYINTKDTYDNTPLHKACIFDNNIDTIKLLVENGADIDVKNVNDGGTPLNLSNNEAYEYLINHK